MTSLSSGQRQSWRGGALLGAGWATFAGEVGDNREHAHHALQMVVSPEGTVRLCIRGRGEVQAPAVLLAADVFHRLEPGSAQLLYVDHQSEAGRQLTATCEAGVRSLSATERDAVRDVWPHAGAPDLTPMLTSLGISMAPTAVVNGRPDRVRCLLEELPNRVNWEGNLASLAAEVALSPSRFRHRVRSLVGMPLRPYLRWLRLRRALGLAAAGADVTRAAQDAGFADAAHLSRTMQRHFGVPPSAVIDALRAR